MELLTLLSKPGIRSSVEGVTDHQKIINSLTNGALFPGTEEVITPEMDVSNNFFNCNKGVISSDLTDDDGMPLQGVTIKLLDAKDVVIALTMTNANGDYLFMDIPPGNYTIEETRLTQLMTPPTLAMMTRLRMEIPPTISQASRLTMSGVW